MSFFNVGALGGNPFSSPLGQKIEQATDGGLVSENWALNMEICDYINDSTDGPRDAIKAIKKRLSQSAGKNYTIVMYTLTVLETCVKNCGKPFHTLVCSKEFIQELVKLIGPKNDPPAIVQEKVLNLIQSWADAFQNQPELSGVVTVYQDLRSKGIEFPMTDLDTMAPIYTPQRSVPEDTVDTAIPAVSIINPNSLVSEAVTASPQRVPASPQNQRTSQTPPNSTVNLSPSQINKLHGDLSIVQGNMTVMNEMLNEMTSTKHHQHHASDLELLHELHTILQAMQARLVELIGKISDDSLTGELLRLNDELNSLMLRYQRFEKNRGAATGTAAPSAVLAAAMGAPPVESKTTPEDSLIDLSDEPPNLSKLTITGADKKTVTSSDKDEFDMFAKSRNLTYENTKTGGSSYADNLNPEHTNVGLVALSQSRPTTGIPQPVEVNERDFDEIAAWLSAEEQATGASLDPLSTQESVTSTDFDKFLAERAAAAESVPTANPQSARQRNVKKDDDSMFAL